MARALYLARVELHNSEDLYDDLHDVMKVIGFKRETTLIGSGAKMELPHATYFGSFSEPQVPKVSKMLRDAVKTGLKVPVRTAKHTRKAKTFSYMVAKIDGVAQVGGLQPKRSTLAIIMEMLEK